MLRSNLIFITENICKNTQEDSSMPAKTRNQLKLESQGFHLTKTNISA